MSSVGTLAAAAMLTLSFAPIACKSASSGPAKPIAIDGPPFKGRSIPALDRATSGLKPGETRELRLRFARAVISLMPTRAAVRRGCLTMHSENSYIKIMPDGRGAVGSAASPQEEFTFTGFDWEASGIHVRNNEDGSLFLGVSNISKLTGSSPPIPRALWSQRLRSTGQFEGVLTLSVSHDFEGEIGGWEAFRMP